jgi:hypothetical protein
MTQSPKQNKFTVVDRLPVLTYRDDTVARLFVLALGLVCPIFFGTGFYLWWRKRAAAAHQPLDHLTRMSGGDGGGGVVHGGHVFLTALLHGQRAGGG